QPKIDRVSFESSCGGEEDKSIFFGGLPKARYKMMEEDRNDNPGKLIARTQPGSTAKWSKYIGPYRILNNNTEPLGVPAISKG
ncbi:Os11g0143233, partial [Oryza sativa Japonica Group]